MKNNRIEMLVVWGERSHHIICWIQSWKITNISYFDRQECYLSWSRRSVWVICRADSYSQHLPWATWFLHPLSVIWATVILAGLIYMECSNVASCVNHFRQVLCIYDFHWWTIVMYRIIMATGVFVWAALTFAGTFVNSFNALIAFRCIHLNILCLWK